MNGVGNAGFQPASTPGNDNDYSTMSQPRSLLDTLAPCPGRCSEGIWEFLRAQIVGSMPLSAGDMAKRKMPNKQMVVIDWAGCALVCRVRCYVFEL